MDSLNKQEILDNLLSEQEKNEIIDNIVDEYPNKSTSNVRFYQTEHAKETIAIIEDADGSISIGIARAGKSDDKNRLVSSLKGIEIAEGRATKARTTKVPLIKKNFLRGLHAMKVSSAEINIMRAK